MFNKLKFYLTVLKNWSYDIFRYIKFSNSIYQLDSIEKYKGLLSMSYHVIEKGLVMPETRLGFGQGKVVELIDLLNEYKINGYNIHEPEFTHSLKTLNEYIEFHKKNKFDIDNSIITIVR